MPETPLGDLSVVLTQLRNLVANSATFQAAIPVDTYDKAKEHIYLVEVKGGTDQVKRPFAVVGVPGNSFAYSNRSPGIPIFQGVIRLEYETSHDLTEDDQVIRAYNFFGQIASELSVLMDTRRSVTNDAQLRGLFISFDGDVTRTRRSHSSDQWSATIQVLQPIL